MQEASARRLAMPIATILSMTWTNNPGFGLAVSAIPEPTTLSLLAIVGAPLLGRKTES